MSIHTLARGVRRRPRLWIVVASIVGLLTVAVPVAWASHQFTDVPNASPFHDDIGAVKDAGITAGKTCTPPGTPPTYCPSESITREAMAAFVHRGFGRVADNEDGNFSLDGGALTDVAVITVSVGGTAGGTQFVKLDGTVGAVTNTPNDDVVFEISQDGVGEITFLSGFTLGPAGPSGLSIGSGATTVAVAVPSASTQTFRLEAADFANSGGIQAWGELSASTAPFGSAGGNVLSVGTAVAGNGGLKRK
jgi:hypothetical protein